ncbi:MAG: flagellar biosynthesis anti-sigma factor FlgM [Candidatus Schekmanbacteria bacterium]|nr:MAG: flagellar biosynthesis anti-sigma factor FlgM [Candidatus Schekmanbacteria bacterium]
MKVDEKNNIISKISNIKTEQKAIKNVSQKPKDNDSDDIKVKISSQGVKLSEYVKKIKEIEGNRAEKIQNLKKSIEEGTYKVDAEKIADKIIKDYLQEIADE